jgi:hypothetical protein
MKPTCSFAPLVFLLCSFGFLLIAGLAVQMCADRLQFEIDAKRPVQRVTVENGVPIYHFTVTAKRN